MRKPLVAKKKGPLHCCKGPLKGSRQLPTLPHCCAVPSAMGGLTSLFGMGRGGHPRQNHHKDVGATVRGAAASAARGLRNRMGPAWARKYCHTGKTLGPCRLFQPGRAMTPSATGPFNKIKAYGLLVPLGYDVTTFTPMAYRRSSLLRPLKVNSSSGEFHA